MNGVDFVLDTNVIIDFLAGHADAVGFMQRNTGKRFGVSPIAQIELLAPAHLTIQDEAAIYRFLSRAVTLPMDQAVQQAAIDLRRRFGLKAPDAIIAATAVRHNATLVTRDRQLLNPHPHVTLADPGQSPCGKSSSDRRRMALQWIKTQL